HATSLCTALADVTASLDRGAAWLRSALAHPVEPHPEVEQEYDQCPPALTGGTGTDRTRTRRRRPAPVPHPPLGHRPQTGPLLHARLHGLSQRASRGSDA